MIYLIFKRNICFLTLILFALSPVSLISQNITNPTTKLLNEIHHKAEVTYGLDDRLVNGTIYKPLHPFAKGHPYFLNGNWKEGSLFIHGLHFNDLLLNYNIETDEIILNLKVNSELTRPILLKKSSIDSLIIDGHFFINSTTLKADNSNGFYEQIYKGSQTAFYKHSIELENEATYSSPNGEYLKAKQTLFIKNIENHFTKIQNKKALLTYFFPHKKSIKVYLRKNRIIYKRINSAQLFNLLKYCDEISSK